MSKDIKGIINSRKVAFKNKDTITGKQLDRDLKNKLREAKQVHRNHLEETFKERNPKDYGTIRKN